MKGALTALICGKVFSNFYSSCEDEKGWVLLARRIKEWVDSLFPSSNTSSCLISVDENQSLANGQNYRCVAVSSIMQADQGQLARSASFAFARGPRRQDLCDLKYSVHFDEAGLIVHIVRTTHKTTQTPGGWVEDLDNFHANEMLTPREKFAQALLELEGALRPVLGKSGQPIAQDHPLINRRPNSRILWSPPGSGPGRLS